MTERAQILLELADDELVIGWRDSEWTGIAPTLEEDVAFSSIAQNEIGHARALYELAARELGTTADELAFDREPSEYLSAPLVELRLVPDWAGTIARHYLYETADAIRIEALKQDGNAEVAGLAAKIDREEVYHRMHAEMWVDRLGAEAEIEVVLDDSWSTDRITPEGREKLRASGFAPPTPRTAGGPRLVQLESNAFRCPYCGSTETALENIFGPTPCRSIRYCKSCRQPFEQFKTI